MLSILFTILSLLHEPISELHEWKISNYEIKPVDDGVQLFIRFDRKDILNALQQECENYNNLSGCFEGYIKEHVILSFDESLAEFVLVEQVFKERFIELKLLDTSIKKKQFRKIDVSVNSLLEVDEDQENIIHFFFGEKKRSFRLNRNRLKTTVAYTNS